MPDYGNERVLCVPTDAVKQIGEFQGFSPEWAKYLHNLLKSGLASFELRKHVETDPRFKQIIPYMVIEYRNPDLRTQSILRYCRTKHSGEARLRGKITIGIGGHINPVDGIDDPTLAFEMGWRRELREEVRIDARYEIAPIGVLNDDSDDVGKVHFGVVLRVGVSKPCVYPNNHESIEMFFDDAKNYPFPATPNYEGWSRLVLDSDSLIKR